MIGGSLALLVLVLSQFPSGLEGAVRSWWSCLEKGDREGQLRQLVPEARNQAIGVPFLPVTAWKIREVKVISSASASVTVAAVLATGRGEVPTLVIQQWELRGDDWFLILPEMSSRAVNEALYGGKPHEPVKGRFLAVPPELVLHFLNPVQTGSFKLHNGLDEPVQIESCAFDQEVLRVVLPFDPVLPGATGAIRVEVLSASEEKDRTATIDCRFASDSGGGELRLLVRYNHIPPETRAFLGLTEAEGKRLRRGEKVSPAVRIPQQFWGAGVKPRL